ncbi:MAG: HAMP domain-containing protein, partial [Desulfamplus sp.]|nr:HAMP domain-containing protein [Desulfamplus sp.]
MVSILSFKLESLQNLSTRQEIMTALEDSSRRFEQMPKQEQEQHISDTDGLWKQTTDLLWNSPNAIGGKELMDLWKKNPSALWDTISSMCQKKGEISLDPVISTMKQLAQNDAALLLNEIFIYFYERLKGQSIFSEVFLTNRYGVNVAMTSIIEDYYQADEEWWQRTMVEGIYLSEVQYDQSIQGYGIIIAVRLNDLENRPVGVVKAVISSSWIMREVRAVTRLHEYTDIKVVTRSGKLIYSSKPFNFFEDVSFRPFFKNTTSSSGYEIVKEGNVDKLYAHATLLPDAADADGDAATGAAFKPPSMTGTATDAAFKPPAMTGTATDAAFKHPSRNSLDNMDWMLFIGHKVEDVLSPMYNLQKRMIMVYSAVMVFSLVVAIFFSRRLTRAIISVRDAAMRVTEGDLTHRIPLAQRIHDELGELAASFNIMTSRLENSYAELEQEIGVRKAAEKAAEAANKAKSAFL